MVVREDRIKDWITSTCFNEQKTSKIIYHDWKHK